MTHETVIETVKNMPKEFNLYELVERLAVIEKIDEAQKDVAAGRIYTHSQMLKMVEEWKK